MPYFFQYTLNYRGQNDKKKSVLKPNKSTMNRLCARFDSMPNINMNLAGVPPFNWQMLMRNDIHEYNVTAIKIFADIDQNANAQILASQAKSLEDKVEILDYDNIAETIIYELQSHGISLEDAYPSITKYLFTGENESRIAHKQMYWRVFGKLAVEILQENLANSHTCSNCNMQVPDWVKIHDCSKQMKGFVKCIDCGKVVERKGPRQCRCSDCEKENRRIYINKYHSERNKKLRRKASEQVA